MESLRVPAIGYGWVRLLPAIGAVASVGLAHIPELAPTGRDWLLALTSAALTLFGGRRPLAVTLAQSGLLAVAAGVAATDIYIVPVSVGVVQLLTCVALGELALRRPGQPTWWGVVAVAAASASAAYRHYPLAANALAILFEVGLPVLLGLFLRSVRELARQAEQRASEAERRQVWEVKAARAAERTAIARELHDVVAHHVASIVLRVAVVRHVVAVEDPRLLETLDDVHAIGGQALADLRRLVSVLRDPDSVSDDVLLAATDLSAALSTVIERTRTAGVAVEVAIDAAVVEELDTVHRHAVLRIVQEGLTNVLRHAGPAARAGVCIGQVGDERILVEVSDDGTGTSPRPTPTEPGHGLIVMRERVELLDGSFDAGRVGTGWVLSAALPGARAEVVRAAK